MSRQKCLLCVAARHQWYLQQYRRHLCFHQHPTFPIRPRCKCVDCRQLPDMVTGVCHHCQPCSATVPGHQQRHQGSWRCSATSCSLFHTASSSIPSFPALFHRFFCTFLTGHTNSHPVYPHFIVYSLLQVVINIYSVYHKIFTDPIENADLLGENGVEKILFVVLYMGG